MVRQGRVVKGAGSGAGPAPAQTCPRISDVCQLSSWEARAALIQFIQTDLQVHQRNSGSTSLSASGAARSGQRAAAAGAI